MNPKSNLLPNPAGESRFGALWSRVVSSSPIREITERIAAGARRVQVFDEVSNPAPASELRARFDLEAGAELDLIVIHGDSAAALTKEIFDLSVAAGARVRIFALNTIGRPGSAIRQEFRFALNGRAASAQVQTLDLLSADAVKELVSEARHDEPETRSEITSRSLIKDSAVLDWESTVRIAEGAPSSFSRQLSKNILLTPGARALARPRLQIRNTAVDSRHGAATGHLRDDEIFYLRTRGLSPESSRRTVAEGFAREWAATLPSCDPTDRIAGDFVRILTAFFGDAA